MWVLLGLAMEIADVDFTWIRMLLIWLLWIIHGCVTEDLVGQIVDLLDPGSQDLLCKAAVYLILYLVAMDVKVYMVSDDLTWSDSHEFRR